MNQENLNQVYTRPSMSRRYEVWFFKLQLADGSGAWWFRYLTTNIGRPDGGGCSSIGTKPLQVWATWFPREGKPQSFIQGFSLDGLQLTNRGEAFRLEHGLNLITHDGCTGSIQVHGHKLDWNLRYRSTSGFSMSDVGWIGFSRTPHTDAIFDGEINFDGRKFTGSPLGYGLQGHNCGFRHRNLWSWAHAFSINKDGSHTTFEALEYEIGLGFYFRKGLLWHEGRLYSMKKFSKEVRERGSMRWSFTCSDPKEKVAVNALFDGSGENLQKIPYTKTDCSGTFEVSNNSLAQAQITIHLPGRDEIQMNANAGAVLEMVGGQN